MKRINHHIQGLMAVVSAIGLFVSCSKPAAGKGQQSDTAVRPAIVFGMETVTENTKAITETTVDQVREGGFKVASVDESSKLFFNEVAYWNEDSGLYRTEVNYFWPSEGRLEFYAVYPKSQAVRITAGKAYIDYVSDLSCDLVAAKASGTIPDADGFKTQLVFGHVLSRISFTAKGTVPDVYYRIKTVTLATPAGGIYSYEDGMWTNGAADDRLYFDGAFDTQLEYAAFGQAVTVIPGDVEVTIDYDVLDESRTTLLGRYQKTAAVHTDMGRSAVINATLPFDDASPVTFSITVTPWGTVNHDMNL